MSVVIPSWACSGSFLPFHYNGFDEKYIYDGLGLKPVTCEYCKSEYYFSKENTSCKNCGAVYTVH